MQKKIFITIVLIALMVGLIAPFTFQKIVQGDMAVDEKTSKLVKAPVVIEKPLHSVELPKFSKIGNVKQKKRQFFNFIRPSITHENQLVLSARGQIKTWREKVSLEEPLSEQEQLDLAALVKRYKVNKQFSLLQQLDELLVRVDIVPAPLILVQAANESAWGTSRFARIGLNFFGIWCYREGCGMVPNGRNEGAKHEVAAFDSVNEAVNRYLYNINTNNAYSVFRAIRTQLREQGQPLQAEVLATGLLPYSERGTDYVLEISEMLRHNQAYFVKSKP